ncbi:OpgC family protein [uncultured Thiodictyon sp.]|uniref:OpgC family protein n=1 Tax=uncultured Thiodictyon sp. TaxID=1846217 RepID=UPI0025FCBDAA|nr:OpgC domain-containing protein [uncultured Thiodictyon sp.]
MASWPPPTRCPLRSRITNTLASAPRATAPIGGPLTAPGRNHLLDFFRGWALLVIFVNHIPANEWSLYTPSRFGLSDASEIFVFLSGFAAAIAYGRSFRVAGLAVGTAQVLLRCGQIYAAHLGLFFALAAICVMGNALWMEPDYISRLNLGYFFTHTPAAVLGLVTLTYVPNYFDILPMYLVVLLWLPVFWALSRVHSGLALGASLAVYLAMWFLDIGLPADPLSQRPWYFNPFAWQLLFFLGFAFGGGWLKVPPAKGWLIALALLVVLLSIPIGHGPTYQHWAFWGDWRATLEPLLDKTRLGPLRVLHFLCLAYLAVSLLRTRGHWLKRPLPGLIATAGRQSLSIFMLGMALSYIAGMLLDRLGHGASVLMLVNLGGLALLFLVARALAWLGQKPWKYTPETTAGVGSVATRWPGPWVWAGRLTLTAGLLALAISPLVLVREVNGISAAVAARLDSRHGVEGPAVEFPDYGMSPVKYATGSTREQLLAGKGRSGLGQGVSDTAPADQALLRVSLAAGPDLPSAKSRHRAAKPGAARSGSSRGKPKRSS